MTELFVPLQRLLGCGGDPRLSIDPASGANAYGCLPVPWPDTLSFASSTASSISERAYDRVSNARESLMQSAIAVGIDAAFDARIETMRQRLKAHLGLSRSGAEVVFSPSGTDSCFPIRANFGQWLRWEAALEEMRAYYSVPDAFRLMALTTFCNGAERIITSSPLLRLLPPQQRPADAGLDDEELAQTTIFPFVMGRDDRMFSLGDCRKIYRGLARDAEPPIQQTATRVRRWQPGFALSVSPSRWALSRPRLPRFGSVRAHASSPRHGRRIRIGRARICSASLAACARSSQRSSGWLRISMIQV